MHQDGRKTQRLPARSKKAHQLALRVGTWRGAVSGATVTLDACKIKLGRICRPEPVADGHANLPTQLLHHPLLQEAVASDLVRLSRLGGPQLRPKIQALIQDATPLRQLIADGLSLLIERHHKDGRLGT